jgi:hypothetical protein
MRDGNDRFTGRRDCAGPVEIHVVWVPIDHRFNHNIAALALNEYFADQDLGPLVAYSYDL